MNLLSAGLALLKAAPSGEQSTGSTVITFVMFGLIFVVFYLFMIRPQKKKEKEAKALRESVKKGDRVVTIGGVHGVVVKVYEQTVLLQIHDAKIEFSKGAISTVTPKDQPKEQKVEVVANSSEDPDLDGAIVEEVSETDVDDTAQEAKN